MPLVGSDGNYVTQSVGGTPGFVSLAAVSAVSSGAVLNGIGAHNNHTMVVVSGAGVSGGVVALQGSLDNQSWFNLPGTATVTTSTANTIFAPVVITDCPVQFIRAAITTIITGGTISATVASG